MMQQLSVSGDFRVLKLVTADVSQIMNFFMENPKKRENFFIFFHEDIPLEDHEELFGDYLETLASFLHQYCHDSFKVTESFYESYPRALQIRYTLHYQNEKELS